MRSRKLNYKGESIDWLYKGFGFPYKQAPDFISIPSPIYSSKVSTGGYSEDKVFNAQHKSLLKNRISAKACNFDDSGYQAQLRRGVTASLEDMGDFVYIESGKKKPVSVAEVASRTGSVKDFNGFHVDFNAHYVGKKSKWLVSKTAPATGNYGFAPNASSRVVVFDIDVRDKKATSHLTPSEARLENLQQSLIDLRALTEALGVAMKDAVRGQVVVSPSGGLHFYCVLPFGTGPIGTFPCGAITEDLCKHLGISEPIKGDIRTGGAAGYVLCPGSAVEVTSGGVTESLQYCLLDAFDKHLPDWVPTIPERKLAIAKKLNVVSKDTAKKLRNAKSGNYRKDSNSSGDLGTTSVEKRDTNENEAKCLGVEFVFNTGSSNKITVEVEQAVIENVMAISENSTNSESFTSTVTEFAIESAMNSMSEKGFEKFHEKRAFLFSCFGCCATNLEVIDIWQFAGVDRDSSKPNRVSYVELKSDLLRLRKKLAKSGTKLSCGAYCRNGRVSLAHTANVKNESVVKLNKHATIKSLGYLTGTSNTKGMFKRRDPQMINTVKAMQVILGGKFYKLKFNHETKRKEYVLRGKPEKLKVGNSYATAIFLVLYHFNPIFNTGARTCLASVDYLSKNFKASKREIRQALQILRDKKVIKVARKQAPGVAPTYKIGADKFKTKRMGESLKATWAASGIAFNDVFLHLGGYFSPNRSRIVRADGSVYANSYLTGFGRATRSVINEVPICSTRKRKTVYRKIGPAAAERTVKKYLAKALAFYEAAKKLTALKNQENAILAVKNLGVSDNINKALKVAEKALSACGLAFPALTQALVSTGPPLE